MTTAAVATKSLDTLILKDTKGMSDEEKQQHFDEIHRISSDTLVASTEQIKSTNEEIAKGSTDLKTLTEKLSDTAVNDDTYSQVLNAVGEGVKLIESVIPLSF